MINRSTPPKATIFENISLRIPDELILDNGMKLYYLSDVNAEVLRLEFLIPAGLKYGTNNLIPKATSDLLLSGTSEKTSAQIAESIDYYGAFVETGISNEYISIQVYTLRRYLSELLSIMEEVFSDIAFPEKEILTYSENKKQSLMVNEQKVSFLSKRKFKEILFGLNHPYGRHSEMSDFDSLDRNDLLQFFTDYVDFSKAVVFAAGKLDNESINIIAKKISGFPIRSSKKGPSLALAKTSDSMIHHLQKDRTVQSAIRMGKVMFQKSHKDYMDFTVLNVLLGGYFGSRLMTNIREDKGYTYGIGSGIVTMRDAGYFVISAEVGSKVTNAAIDEIYIELDKLRNISVGEEELSLVKNYMLGSFMRAVDGSFSQIDWFSGIYQHGLEFDFYENYLNAIKRINAKRIQELAQTYLRDESLFLLTTGSVPFEPAAIRIKH